MDLAPGQLIGTYRIIRLLGQGGMGAVYEVEHTQLGVHYALKTFTLEGGHVDLLKNKFLTEGKVLARLHDPHLVRVFDLNFDEATGMPYFVMDLVLSEDGSPRTLLDVKTEELDEDCVLEWFVDLASAIDDVNAVNTMVSEAATGARLVMGTQGYMAPEVVWGGEATPASDSYSLGVMFVYLLTGIWYTPASKVFKLLEALEYRWIDVLPRLLSVKPLERPTNLSKLVEQLRSVPAAEPEKVEGLEAPRRKRRVLFALAGAAAVVVAAVGYFVFYHRPVHAAVDDFDAAFSDNGIYEGARR